jgi:hypothetical protein
MIVRISGTTGAVLQLGSLRRSPPFSVLFLVCLLQTACTPEPLELPDWTIPVPEGTRIIEYADVPLEERTERIELVEDLVIAERQDDPNYAFYYPIDVAVDDDGRIYVADARDARVKVFDKRGEYLRSLGQKGQGPGELTTPFSLAIAGDCLVVGDPPSFRLSIRDLNGTHLGDEYQVLALDRQGGSRWALRVAWNRRPVTEENQPKRVRRIPEALSHLAFDISSTEWPDYFGSISRLALDGRGRRSAFWRTSPKRTVPTCCRFPRGWGRASGDAMGPRIGAASCKASRVGQAPLCSTPC